ncbi:MULTISPECIES: YugN family protein [Paenibacillus]|uniref:YugN family protein n=1 Tax=Paenibacillus TaxID=44249 RepID=UPI0022B8BC8E|nr:YugN family protein [Paenibacillus caseinilyticus]MCZ8520229.1 YugN family protein [Paenibacillus caseinilyticus]
MIIENSGLKGLKSDLAHLDDSMEQLGFVRWQWEYYRATYDLQLKDRDSQNDFFLRINTRVETGKLESPHAILYIEDVYIGQGSFPHGVNYQAKIPDYIMKDATSKLAQLKTKLTS